MGKERRLEKKQKKMGLQNQILQTIVDSNKNNNKINTKMKFINIEMLKSEKDGIKINEEGVITIQVTNNNNNKNNNISQNIEESILQNEKAQKKIKEPVTQVVETKAEVDEEKEKKEKGEVSNKSLLEVVEAKAGCWNRQLFILNPDLEITSTIKQTFEAHGCEVQVGGGVERDLAYLYVLLDRKVSIKRLRRLMERGKKFGLEFFLTKTGLTSSLLARNLGRIFYKP